MLILNITTSGCEEFSSCHIHFTTGERTLQHPLNSLLIGAFGDNLDVLEKRVLTMPGVESWATQPIAWPLY